MKKRFNIWLRIRNVVSRLSPCGRGFPQFSDVHLDDGCRYWNQFKTYLADCLLFQAPVADENYNMKTVPELGQLCVRFASSGPAIDPRVLHILSFSADSRRVSCQLLRKNGHLTLVNCLREVCP